MLVAEHFECQDTLSDLIPMNIALIVMSGCGTMFSDLKVAGTQNWKSSSMRPSVALDRQTLPNFHVVVTSFHIQELPPQKHTVHVCLSFRLKTCAPTSNSHCRIEAGIKDASFSPQRSVIGQSSNRQNTLSPNRWCAHPGVMRFQMGLSAICKHFAKNLCINLNRKLWKTTNRIGNVAQSGLLSSSLQHPNEAHLGARSAPVSSLRTLET